MSKSRMSFETEITNGNVTGLFPNKLDTSHLEAIVANLWEGFSGRVKVVLEEEGYTIDTTKQDKES